MVIIHIYHRIQGEMGSFCERHSSALEIRKIKR